MGLLWFGGVVLNPPPPLAALRSSSLLLFAWMSPIIGNSTNFESEWKQGIHTMSNVKINVFISKYAF